MGSLSDIKRRLVSVKQTRRITGAMKTVAVSKMRKLSDIFENYREYVSMLEHIAKTVSAASAYFETQPIDRDMIVVLSSDRGLCGGFDHDILKLADSLVNVDTLIVPVGSAAARHYADCKNAIFDFAGMYGTEFATAEKISKFIFEVYGKTVGTVSIVYATMQSRSAYKPTVKTLLPVQKQADTENNAELIIEPSPEDVIATLVPMYLSAVVYGALIENAVSENSARSAAMTAATDSADELISKLSVEYNRARQATVTEQITEITGAVGALKGQGD